MAVMRNRYYNPRLMRFVNADPIKFDGGLNWYAFSKDNPVGYIDPSGLWTFGFGYTAAGGAVVGGTASSGLYVGHDPKYSWYSGWSVGWLTSGGGGGFLGIGYLRGGRFVQLTDAASVFDLKGPGLSVGGSVGEAVSGGVEYNTGLEKDPGSYWGWTPTYHGVTGSWGVANSDGVRPIYAYSELTWNRG